MNQGGFILFLVGALALAGFLTGNLDRWLGFLFVPTGESMGVSGAVTRPPPAGAAPAAGVVAPSANQRGLAG